MCGEPVEEREVDAGQVRVVEVSLRDVEDIQAPALAVGARWCAVHRARTNQLARAVTHIRSGHFPRHRTLLAGAVAKQKAAQTQRRKYLGTGRMTPLMPTLFLPNLVSICRDI